MAQLEGKQILLGITAGIAAYKAADVCSQLIKLGAIVHVVMTPRSTKFIGVTTMQALSQNQVLVDLFDEPQSGRIAHIDVAQSCDLCIVAPAGADVIAKMAQGLCDDMLTTCLLALPSETPLIVAPAMNRVMWTKPATQQNIATLEARGVQIIQPVEGLLACQDEGIGKLAPVEAIVAAICVRLSPGELRGKHVVLTVGATREPIDPVRFISNRSSGKMGFALATEALRRGAEVTVIQGHTDIPAPSGIAVRLVETAHDMLNASLELAPHADVFIGVAAVTDYAPANPTTQKLKKVDSVLTNLELKQTEDIIATVSSKARPDQLVVGFAAETEDLLLHAQDKLVAKGVDMIVANDVSSAESGFGTNTNAGWILQPNAEPIEIALTSKSNMAATIIDAIVLRLENLR